MTLFSVGEGRGSRWIGVENARDADQGECGPGKFPEDDVPEEYQNED